MDLSNLWARLVLKNLAHYHQERLCLLPRPGATLGNKKLFVSAVSFPSLDEQRKEKADGL